MTYKVDKNGNVVNIEFEEEQKETTIQKKKEEKRKETKQVSFLFCFAKTSGAIMRNKLMEAFTMYARMALTWLMYILAAPLFLIQLIGFSIWGLALARKERDPHYVLGVIKAVLEEWSLSHKANIPNKI